MYTLMEYVSSLTLLDNVAQGQRLVTLFSRDNSTALFLDKDTA